MSGPGPENAPSPEQPATPPPGPMSTPPSMPAWTSALTSTAPTPGPAGLFYADVPNRIIAFIIDSIIVGIVIAVVSVVLPSVITVNPTPSGLGDLFVVNWIGVILHAAASIVISGGYFIYMWSVRRSTVGMMVLGMQIGNETDGTSLSMEQAAIRWALLALPGQLSYAVFAAPAIGGLLILASFLWTIALLVTTAQSPTKQGLHDRYAHTIMAKAARSVA